MMTVHEQWQQDHDMPQIMKDIEASRVRRAAEKKARNKKPNQKEKNASNSSIR